MKKFTADFETTTDINDCRVWAWAVCEIGNPENFLYGNSIETFIDWCSNTEENYDVYFHNLKFDGSFLFDWLLRQNYEVLRNTKNKEDSDYTSPKNHSFTCLIDELNNFYNIEVWFTIGKKKTNKVKFYDSMKILNFGVDKIAHDFKLPISKLKLDYKEYREVGHQLTAHEIAYIRNDVEIMARALKIMFDEGLDKSTIASNAMNFYKSNFEEFNEFFPILEFDVYNDIRPAYKGGFTYLNPVYENKMVNKPIVCLDVNSLYPSVMKNALLPYGNGVYFEGKYKDNPYYPLYIQHLKCSFELKSGKIPTIQLKGNLSFLPNEYVVSSNGECVDLKLTNIDLKLFLENYEVEYYDVNTHNISKEPCYINGFMFKGQKGLFDFYIDYWSEKKIEAKHDGNGARYTISKIMLNSLYGKFAMSKMNRNKYPYLDEETDTIKYELSEAKEDKGVYLPMACFITSYAREKTQRTSGLIKDYSINKLGYDAYIYSDTDSIYTTLTDENILNKLIEIDKYKLGSWDLELKCTRGKWLRQKCYMVEYLDEDGKKCYKTTVAGLPKELGKALTFKNFTHEFSCSGKLRPVRTKGGVVLEETTFTIK